MPDVPDFFRDHGIIPYGVSPPSGRVRAYFPGWQVFGQYAATGLMSLFGLGFATLAALTMPLPANVLVAVAALAGIGFLVHFVTRNDYAWIELDGDTLRAKHLYTGRVIERSVDEIKDLLTLVIAVRTATTMLVDAWLGRVRGVEIRFRDGRTPLRVQRTDPAMKNARELIEAVISRMAERGEVDAEITHPQGGQPLLRRVYWKADEP